MANAPVAAALGRGLVPSPRPSEDAHASGREPGQIVEPVDQAEVVALEHGALAGTNVPVAAEEPLALHERQRLELASVRRIALRVVLEPRANEGQRQRLAAEHFLALVRGLLCLRLRGKAPDLPPAHHVVKPQFRVCILGERARIVPVERAGLLLTHQPPQHARALGDESPIGPDPPRDQLPHERVGVRVARRAYVSAHLRLGP